MPETRDVLAGCGEADSLVVNPHKWLFVPFDLSAFYCRRMDTVRAAFSLTPDYLRTPEAGAVRNLMDTGVQLGRRFRSLKLWAVLRHFGSDGIRDSARRAHAPGPAVRGLGGREPRLRAPGPRPVQRRLLPRGTGRQRAATARGGRRERQRRPAPVRRGGATAGGGRPARRRPAPRPARRNPAPPPARSSTP